MTVTTTASVPTDTLHRVNLDGFLRGLHGKFVGVDFIKQDGSIRALNGRLGVRKHLVQGGPSTVAGENRPYLVMYDMKVRGYRAVNLASVGRVRVNHKHYAVIG